MSQTNENSSLTGLEIAVIGMAGRFPGAENIDEFWKNLEQGVESISFFTNEELEKAGVDPQLLLNPNYVKGCGFLKNSEYFDAFFFDYTSTDAEIMDPQIRIFHECAWEALEDAGYDPYTYKKLIGCYAGAAPNFLWEASIKLRLARENEGITSFEAEQLYNRDYLCTRLAHSLNLRGPAVAIQTACSTSLVAIHLACQGLICGECDMAVAGGVSILRLNKEGYPYVEGMILSPDGHCRAFDEKAKGCVFGDGAGVVILKRLDDALRDRDHILALVKGSFINNDGLEKSGYTAPGIDGQAAVIRAALQAAEVEAETIGYVETHGTGTELGDPVEFEGLKLAFNSEEKKFCALGAVKTNVGHLNTASGVAGFIKTVLTLKHKRIPPTLHFKAPNPRINFENSPFYITTALKEWENKPYPRRAGISSFGIGGTNAHIILEEAPTVKDNQVSSSRDYQLLLFSAKTSTALHNVTTRFAEYIKQHPEISMADAAYTLKIGRKALAHRKMLVCSTSSTSATGSTIDEAVHALTTLASDKVHIYALKKNENKPVVFMFPGQGSQYVNMGLELYQQEPAFRDEMNRCFEMVKPLLGYDLKEILYPGECATSPVKANPRDIDQTEVAQPVLFIFAYALAKLLLAWGIKPVAMTGHSIGEYTAACLAGVFSLADGLKLVVLRGKLMQRMPGGAMLGVQLPSEEVTQFCSGGLSLAAANSTGLSVVSGTYEAVAALHLKLQEKGHNSRYLHTSHAFHSQMMDPILAEFEEQIKTIRLNKPEIPYVSNVTGQLITDRQVIEPGYWAQQIRGTVQFSRGLETLLAEGDAIFVEVGAGNTLNTFVRQHAARKPGHLLVNLVRPPREQVSDLEVLLSGIGHLWLYGRNIHWHEFYAKEKRNRVPLPTYPFERQSYRRQMEMMPHMLKAFSQGHDGLHNGLSMPLPGTFPASAAQEDEGKTENSQSFHRSRELTTQYVAPRNDVESKLVSIWQKFFELQEVGIFDNFFDLGGNSLNLMTMASKIHREFNVRIALKEMFNYPTIAMLASAVERLEKEQYCPIEPVEKKEYYVLSPAQKRLYILHQFEKNSTAYNMPRVVSLDSSNLDGDVDNEKLSNEKLSMTFRKIINRHESLRTSFEMIDGHPVQRVHDDKNLEFNISSFTCSELEAETMVKEFCKPFDLSKAPLLRVGLLTVDSTRRVLLVDMHHIITDGTSQGILENEFRALSAGAALPPLPLQYKDYSEWYNGALQQEAIKKQESYWLREFSDELPVLDLPTDYPRPATQSFEGNSVRFGFNARETGILKAIAKEHDTTLYMTLLALFGILLAKLGRQEDIIIGTPIAARRHADLANVIGMLVNTLAMRNFPAADKPFNEFLREVRLRTLDAYESQEYPFEVLVDKITINRDAGRNPVFAVMFNLLNQADFKADDKADYKNEAHGQNEQGPYLHIKGTSKFDMNLTAVEIGETLLFIFEYSSVLFKPERIERIIGYFKNILKALAHNTGLRIAEIELMGEAEKEKILKAANGVEVIYEQAVTIHRLFEDQVAKTPDNIALAGPTLGNHSISDQHPSHVAHLTYSEVNEQATRLAHRLSEKGVGPDSAVGIMIERSVEMITGIMGILKSGGAYLPIDPECPQERSAYMLKDSSAKMLLTANEIASLSSADVFNSQPSAFSIHHSSHLAYIIYTSGTTGKPKGVMIDHGAAVNLLLSLQNEYPVTSSDTYLLKTSYIFDVSVTELFGWYLGGSRLAILAKDSHKDPRALVAAIEKNNVSHINFVPSMFNAFIEHITGENKRRLMSLKYIFLAGEALLPPLVEKFRRLNTGIRLENIYGPTESTVYAGKYSLSGWDGTGCIPIGGPLPNIKLYILNKENDLQPVGVAGELFIGGSGLARGYLNRPELTVDKFIVIHHAIFYSTGDLVRWLPDGNIEFLGRIDNQVKIRGFRVEPGEIENRLAKQPGVKEAVVLVQKEESESGEPYLCAYIVPDGDNVLPGLRASLAKELPDYMIPSYFVHLDKIPLTSSGKIDRRALPRPEAKKSGGYVAPVDEIEAKMVAAWSEILGMEKNLIGTGDNFFHLGGHSLKALSMINKIHKTFGVIIALQDIFRHPTIAQVSRIIKNSKVTGFTDIEKQPEKEYYELSYAQKRLWFISKTEPDNPLFNMPEGTTLYEAVDEALVRRVVERLTARHESLRTSFKEINKEPVQVIEPAGCFDRLKINLDVIDLSELSGPEREKRRHELHMAESVYIFNLERPPLFKIKILKCAAAEYDLVFNMHHIISDGWSMEILKHEFRQLFEAYKNGSEPQLGPLELQYKDYAAWQNRLLADKEQVGKAQEFWRGQLSGNLPVLNLPYDFARPPGGDNKESAGYRWVIPTDLTSRLRTMAEDRQASLFMVLLAGINLLLAQVTGQKEIMIAIPAAARQHDALKNIIGLFVNTLILSNRVAVDEPFTGFFNRLQDNTFKVLEYQGIPLELICGQLKIKYPDVSVFFNMVNTGSTQQENIGNFDSYHLEKVQNAKFDIVFYLTEYENGIAVDCHYYKNRFQPVTIETLMEQYKNILAGVSSDPARNVGEYFFSGKKKKLTRSPNPGNNKK